MRSEGIGAKETIRRAGSGRPATAMPGGPQVARCVRVWQGMARTLNDCRHALGCRLLREAGPGSPPRDSIQQALGPPGAVLKAFVPKTSRYTFVFPGAVSECCPGASPFSGVQPFHRADPGSELSPVKGPYRSRIQ